MRAHRKLLRHGSQSMADLPPWWSAQPAMANGGIIGRDTRHQVYPAYVTGMSNEFMQAAIEEARKGREEGGIPIGAVVVHRGKILGRGHNRRVQQGSAILHGEMDALENAGRQPAKVLQECELYTTLSPCSMCSGAILLYGIPKVVIGENQTFMGEERLLKSRGVELEVLQDAECMGMMTHFIKECPELWNEDIGCPCDDDAHA